MEFRLFTYTSHGAIKSALIAQEEIDCRLLAQEMNAHDIVDYFIGGNIEQLDDHGTIEIDGVNAHMMDSSYISN
jgi:hypothetical protein